MDRQRIRSRRFFERELPALICENRVVFGASRGTVGFVVHEVGDWTVRMGGDAPEQAVVEQTTFDADLTLMFTARAFSALLDGIPPTPGRGFAVAGETKLLNVFARLFGPPGTGPMAARAAGLMTAGTGAL